MMGGRKAASVLLAVFRDEPTTGLAVSLLACENCSGLPVKSEQQLMVQVALHPPGDLVGGVQDHPLEDWCYSSVAKEAWSSFNCQASADVRQL